MIVRVVKHHSSSKYDYEGGGGDNGDGNRSKELLGVWLYHLVMNLDI